MALYTHRIEKVETSHPTARNERHLRRERFLASVRVQAMLANHPFD